MSLALLLALLSIDGTVINKTTGQPVAGATVSLVKASAQGMQPAGSATTGTDGKFSLEGSAEGIALLQTTFENVNYNKLLEPGASTTGIEIPVFSTSKKVQAATVAQHMILIEPVPGELRVRETLIYDNPTQTTLADPANGSIRFFLPPMSKGQAKIDASSGSRGMPLKRAAKPTGEANIYTVDFPLKPGETRFDISWTSPFAPPGDLNTRILHQGQTRVIAPRGVTLKSDALTFLTNEPRTMASVFTAKNGPVSISIEGAGTLANTAPPSEEEDQGPPIDTIFPKLYDRIYWVVGLVSAIFGLAFYLLYRQAPATPRKATK
ncbi:MAG: carboxypeptidase-like regulatory domain-containing protein [Bryobacteraceae bacterium]|nr:carboxypeptidase-like regulatory domain-containing protein [Bryobacteraceae bacterium]